MGSNEIPQVRTKVFDMTSRLDQAMKRLDAAISALESMPMPSTSSATQEQPSPSDQHVSATELAEIRGLIDQAMDIVTAAANGDDHVTK